MSLKCKVFGHKWQEYKEDVTHVTPSISNSHMSVPSITFSVNTTFRYCPKCFTNQIRLAWSDDEKVDWRSVDLSIEQEREKKLKDLGL